MKRVQFAVTYPERRRHPLHRRIVERGPLSRVELLMWSPTADATTLLWCDGDREATASAVESIDSLRARSLVAGADGTYAFLRQDDYEFGAALLEVVADADVLFFPPVVFLETGAVRFEAVGETGALNALHGELSALGDLAVEAARPFERRRAPSSLTDRQRAALESALAVGYYEIPREGTVADIADALDCSTSTAGELVRKAEAAVVRSATATGGAGDDYSSRSM